jgi:hypothetical protein
LLDLKSNKAENGFVWISIAGLNKTDTLFVHVHQCSLKNVILKSKLCIDSRNIFKIVNFQGKCINKENITRQLILYNKKKIINTK